MALSRLDAGAARELSRSLLADTLPQRWTHVQAVAAEAHRLSGILDVADQPLVVAAAWLHDIGYAPAVAVTGQHALDGARFLRAHGWDDRLCSLVAHHSAAQHGPAGEFGGEQSATSDLLWFVDMTIGHDGRRTTFEDRLAEIAARYGPNSAVSMAMRRATPDLAAAISRTARRMASVPTTGG